MYVLLQGYTAYDFSILLTGIGWGMFFISFISCIYYNMLIAYSFFYMFASFNSKVPWEDCKNDWNTPGTYIWNNIIIIFL